MSVLCCVYVFKKGIDFEQLSSLPRTLIFYQYIVFIFVSVSGCSDAEYRWLYASYINYIVDDENPDLILVSYGTDGARGEGNGCEVSNNDMPLRVNCRVDPGHDGSS